MKIQEPAANRNIAPLWRLAFRAGFLCTASFAVLAMARWLLWMINAQQWDYQLSPYWWHAHEMLFGFAMPVVAGFLLTAVATWTGLPGTTGWPLKLLFGAWLAARLVLWLTPAHLALAWLLEMLFMLLLISALTRRVWIRRQWRNLLFVPVLSILALLDCASFWYADDPLMSTRLHYGGIWVISTLVVIIGGRVIPLFTGNRLGFAIAPPPLWFETLCIGVTLATGLVIALSAPSTSLRWVQALCLAGFILHLVRLAHWRGHQTWRVPLLWSMHLSYLCIPLTMLALLGAGSDPVAVKHVMHLLAIGTIGGMILTMMSRVSLGHTGRALEVPAYLALAFALLLLAAVQRALLPLLLPSLTQWFWYASALLWMFAFSCFLYRYWPVLTRPRLDGKPG